MVSLPIGNPHDISVRAKTILEKVNYIASEDTRTFKKYCKDSELNVSGQVFAHHEHNEKESAQELLKHLKEGFNVALVCDAGTPNVSDPGTPLLRVCYENNIDVIPIPGPSSLTSALSISPFGGHSSFFGGFPPSKSQARKKEFEENQFNGDQLVYFESPHRLLDHLKDALDVFGNSQVFVCRELTKEFEEKLLVDIKGAIEHFEQHPPRGEFVLVYPKVQAQKMDLEKVREKIQVMLKQNVKDTEIAKQLQKQSQMARQEVYNLIQKVKKS